MDDDPIPRQVQAKPGGSVEPLQRAAVAKERFQTPPESPGERYELRDPFAEVTYRAKTFGEMAAKADEMRSTRFVAVDVQGNRTPVLKVNGQWEKDIPHQVRPHAAPAVDAVQHAAIAAAPPPIRSATPDAAEQNTTRIDAQAERVALLARLQAGLQERYVIKRPALASGDVQLGQTEYRFRGDTTRIAFTETTFRLATDTNSPSVARSMVDVAEARNWKALRVSGNEDFRRLVWLEAAARGVKIVGYEPQPADIEVLKQTQIARLVNRVEPTQVETPTGVAAAKGSGRGGGRKAVLAAIDAILVERGVSATKREAVLAAAEKQLAERTRAGQTLNVKVLDKSAPAQRPPTVQRPTPERSRERASPAR